MGGGGLGGGFFWWQNILLDLQAAKIFFCHISAKAESRHVFNRIETYQPQIITHTDNLITTLTQNKNNFSILSTNIQSIRANFDELNIIIGEGEVFAYNTTVSDLYIILLCLPYYIIVLCLPCG